MVEITLNPEKLGISTETKQLKVDVVPRPEVLIEEE